jgi:hypothetical protein
MRFLTAVFLIMTPLSAVADELCDELWLTRNTVFDRAGYCFGSSLGQAMFDNRDCTTSDPQLDADATRIVDMVREVEEEFDCSVDTSGAPFNLSNVFERLVLQDLPVRTGYESACIGYTGPALLLTGGRHPDSAISGEILPGMDLMFLHIPVDGMDFIDLGNGDMGWVGTNLITPAVCTAIAG